jgi:hypothetical protein
MPAERLKRPRDPVSLAKLIGDIATEGRQGAGEWPKQIAPRRNR